MPSARVTTVGLNVGTSGSWGTGTADATAIGAGDGHFVRDDLGFQMQRQIIEDDSAGQDFIGAVEVSDMDAVTGMIPLYAHSNDLFMNTLWALALGTGETSPTQLGGSTAFTGTFAPATNKTGLYATIVRDKGQDIYEIPGAKCTGFELRSGENGRFEVDFMFVGDMEIEDSTTNTATQISALTFPEQGLRWFMRQMEFRVNAQGGAGLTSDDAYIITSLKVKFDQPLDTIQVGNSTTIVEPEETDLPSMTIEVTFPRFDGDSDDFFSALRGGTSFKADINFVGPAIGTLATTRGLRFDFPNIYTTEFQAQVPGAGGQIQPMAKFTCIGTTAAPTGMTATTPVFVVTTGENSTNPFV